MLLPGDFAPHIRAAIASLQDEASGLPAKIAAYNAEEGHGYELEVPGAEAYFFGGDDTAVVFPYVEVAVPTGRMGNFSQQQVDADVGSDLSVAIWLEGDSGEIPEIYEKALGFGRVAAEVLVEPDAFGNVEVEEIVFTFPTIPVGNYDQQTRRFDKWRSAAVLEFTLADTAARVT